MGMIPIGFTIFLGCVQIFVNYRTANSTSKLAKGLRRYFSFCYNSVYIAFLFMTLVSIISYINGIKLVSECVDGDQTCIRTDPLSAINPNKIYNHYPLTFRTDYDSLRYHVFTWADANGYYAKDRKNHTIQVTIVSYWTFFLDVFVQVEQCYKNKGFMSVLVQGHLRIGYQDLTTDLDVSIKELYEYLAAKHKPSDYSFAMCHSIIYQTFQITYLYTHSSQIKQFHHSHIINFYVYKHYRIKMWSTFAIIFTLLSFSLSSPIFLDEKWETGFVNLDSKHQLFYWLVKSRSSLSKPPLVLWLQGGPGCSGVSTVLTENGPFRIKESLDLEYNPYSWNNKADVLYVDQPLGTGFSNCSDISRIPKTEKDVAKDLKVFLERFVYKHEEYLGRDFYISGQSYAGHFVPSLAKYFLDQKATFLQLKGIAIGNGWFKPEIQISSFPGFDHKHGLVKGPISYLGAVISYYLTSIFIEFDLYKTAKLFFDFGNGIANGISPRFNPYDIRKPCIKGNFCYNTTLIEKFMKRKDVLAELGVGDRVWEQCNGAVLNRMLENDFFSDMTPVLQELLDSYKSLKVVLFNGNQDWFCNLEGMKAFLGQLEWYGKQLFEDSPWQYWYISGRIAGKYKQAGNFTFYDVNDAGHFVSHDQPESAYDILTEMFRDQLSFIMHQDLHKSRYISYTNSQITHLHLFSHITYHGFNEVTMQQHGLSFDLGYPTSEVVALSRRKSRTKETSEQLAG
eukprot:TRINITY_DN3726_c1_g1_i1.p1 TRINITY_DN3726_c1_g1~~TRINITY_DN3726_c1_g1_i1.p1  ORF type:complete len:734 (-),score=35.71 TRINITY_DN3726_c1_g1_i1:5256-7457(-)